MQPLTFSCAGTTLVGAFHAGASATGLVIVSGGLQTRAGPHRLFVDIADAVSAAGHPVLRFDRRGVGDSDGEDGGFLSSGPDIAAAVAALKSAAPAVTRVVGLGLCDGASALALFGKEAGVDALALLNPWTRDDDQPIALSGQATRERYRRRIFSPAIWRRLLTGDINVMGALRGLFARGSESTALERRMESALKAFGGPTLALLSGGDATAHLFTPLARRLRSQVAAQHLPGADHTLTQAEHRDAAVAALLEFMRMEKVVAEVRVHQAH
jgi:exosortase A-associated hydrolase 1